MNSGYNSVYLLICPPVCQHCFNIDFIINSQQSPFASSPFQNSLKSLPNMDSNYLNTNANGGTQKANKINYILKSNSEQETMIKTANDYSSQDSLQSRLSKLRKDIYRPYQSVLGSQNQTLADEIRSPEQKCQSLLLKTRETNNHSTMKKRLLNKKRSIKLPSILKKNSLMAQQTQMQASVEDFVSDPFLNGRIRSQREQVYKKINESSNLYFFLQMVEKHQVQFLQLCYLKKYKEAEEIICRLLNYSIDLNLINELCFSLKILADFHLNCLQFEKSFFYYNECRKCAMIIGQYSIMAQSLIDMGICANKNNLHVEAIRLFKKALQYIWYYDLVSLQLRVYDEFGKTYYTMGDVENAKHFHYKFFSGCIEPKNSSIRLLSKQSLVLQGLEDMTIIKDITSVFLWMIHIPVRGCEKLSEIENPEKKKNLSNSPRKGYTKDMKYFQQFRTLAQATSRVFAEDFFKNELGQMHFNSNDWTVPLRIKKYLSLDIQRNNLLQEKGIPFQNYFSKGKQPKIQKKMSKRNQRSNTEPNSNNQEQRASKNVDKWFGCLAAQAIKKYRNKNSGILNRVNLRGMDKHVESKTAAFRIVFNQYFDLSHLK